MNCRLVSKIVQSHICLQNLVKYYSSLSNPSILGGADFVSERNRYSYFCAEPVEIFEFNNHDEKPFENLKTVLSKYRLEKGIDGVFTGGWIGFFSYDLNRFVEDVPSCKNDDIGLPLIRLCFYDKVICFDHLEKCFNLFAIEFDDDGQEKIKKLENVINCRGEPMCSPDGQTRRSAPTVSNMTQDYYLDAINKTKKHIYDGDVYQINFSQRFTADFNSEASKLFLWQNKFNPSPYSAYIGADDYKIVSASPELFINIMCHSRESGNPDFIITTCPIKGTRPRTGDEEADKKNHSELVDNEKEKAELDMIIDLERNDMGRICEPGTIKVDKRRDIEKFSTVFHAVSTISGKLKKGMDFTDCLLAMFPGGSITGAPKVSAMKIINALEPTARGLYTGSIGWIDLAGNACLNIVIRTIIIKDSKAYVQTGGGIVADSDPQAEWNETLVKAKALLAGINAVCKPQRKE
ncbi:MAG: anthranilate synthase component I family protein [Planctomycetaceae bacterium]|nr:anthranilate synthase component I family protein [Planctomycetaceae bacterium]